MKLKNHSSLIVLFIFLIVLFSCTKDSKSEPEPDYTKVTISTLPPTSVSSTYATLNGNIELNGQKITVADKGFCWSTVYPPELPENYVSDPDPEIDLISYKVTSFKPGTKYYYRLWISVQEKGVYYANILSFTTKQSGDPGTSDNQGEPNGSTGTVTDVEGNVYKTVKIGTQWWMAENLRTKKYNNGDPIPYITKDEEWRYTELGAQTFYEEDSAKLNLYGRLYNWYAVADPRKLAPKGWHIPTIEEWNTFLAHIGYKFLDDNIGVSNKVKAKGNFWKNNTSINNITGFSALPGGYRSYNGVYSGIGEYSHIWSSTAYSEVSARFVYLNYMDKGSVDKSLENKIYGCSVRCIKD